MSKMTLYTDGACSGNPGKGAYAAIIKVGDTEREVVRAFKLTTNNRMELLAIIEPLEAIKLPNKVEIYSDSKYVVDSINKKWLNNWIKNEWKRNSKNKPVLNVDLWKRMRQLLLKHRLTFHWVKGHNGNPMNDKCDELAVTAYNGDEFSEDEGYKP